MRRAREFVRSYSVVPVQALLKPFEHSSLKENHYSRALFNMANNL